MRRVALLVETSKSYGRDLLTGINQYARENTHWSLRFEPRDLFSPPPPWLRTWDGHGIICRLSSPAIARPVLATRLPVVNLSSALPNLRMPRIEVDNQALVDMSFDHLYERGLRRFAFLGDDVDFPSWSHQIGHLFAKRTRREDYPCSLFSVPGHANARATTRRSWERELTALARWTGRLEYPIGIVAIRFA